MARSSKTEPWYIVKRSAIHQRGVFARREIPKGTRIIEYVGERITKTESEKRATRLLSRAKRTGGAAVYIFDISSRTDLDGNVPWNTARLINHSCDPNCEAIDVRGRIWICAKRKIPAGTELAYNYGFDLEEWHEHPCRCGSSLCVGYITGRKYWRRLRELIAARTDRKQSEAAKGAPHHPEVMHARKKTAQQK